MPWDVNPERLKSPSPDLTTNGALQKTWVQDKEKTSWLLKAGSPKYHQESISEVLASMMLKQLGLTDYVEYELAIFGLKFCSKCKNFIDETTEFVPASHIFKAEEKNESDSNISHLIKVCEHLGIKDARQNIVEMVGIDLLLGNNDRHLGNFGFIRDVDTGTFKGFAPLFDSGSAYTSSKSENKNNDYFKEYEEEALKTVKVKIKNKKIDTKEMYRLVKVYPDLSDEERTIIRQKISETLKKIKE